MRQSLLAFFILIIPTLSSAQDTLRAVEPLAIGIGKVKSEFPYYHSVAFSGVYASDLESSNPGISLHYMQRSFKTLSVLYGLGAGALAPDLNRRQELYFLEGRIGTNVQIKRIAHIRLSLLPGLQYTSDKIEALFGFEGGLGWNLWNIEAGVSLGMNTFYTETMFYGRLHLAYIFSPNRRLLPQ